MSRGTPRVREVLAGAGAAAALVLLLLVVVLVAAPDAASAQQGPGSSLASQSMRPYRHVFYAYALAWLIVLGWVVSLGRRWSRVEDDMGEGRGLD